MNKYIQECKGKKLENEESKGKIYKMENKIKKYKAKIEQLRHVKADLATMEQQCQTLTQQVKTLEMTERMLNKTETECKMAANNLIQDIQNMKSQCNQNDNLTKHDNHKQDVQDITSNEESISETTLDSDESSYSNKKKEARTSQPNKTKKIKSSRKRTSHQKSPTESDTKNTISEFSLLLTNFTKNLEHERTAATETQNKGLNILQTNMSQIVSKSDLQRSISSVTITLTAADVRQSNGCGLL